MNIRLVVCEVEEFVMGKIEVELEVGRSLRIMGGNDEGEVVMKT